jgi:SAM-dependent methyltransferase
MTVGDWTLDIVSASDHVGDTLSGLHAREAAQHAANNATWGAGGFLRWYRRSRLRPAETVLFNRYREALSGRVLELGCGGGRLTRHIVALGGELTGIDIGADMVAYCQRRYPTATFSVGDLRDLSAFETASFGAIVAGANVIDVLGNEARAKLLDDLHRCLKPNGVLIFSSHNLACAPLLAGPIHKLSRHPVRFINRVARLVRSVPNHRRLAALQHFGPDYAILNDEAHDYSLLHYYIGRDDQERQLARHGFELLECLALDGSTVAPGESAFGCQELHYAATRSELRSA